LQSFLFLQFLQKKAFFFAKIAKIATKFFAKKIFPPNFFAKNFVFANFAALLIFSNREGEESTRFSSFGNFSVLAKSKLDSTKTPDPDKSHPGKIFKTFYPSKKICPQPVVACRRCPSPSPPRALVRRRAERRRRAPYSPI
jgi:hypothetical protein